VPECEGLEQQDGLSILQILDKMEEVCDTLLSRFDTFSFIMEKVWLITLHKNILKPFTDKKFAFDPSTDKLG
jgi:hypothetical protein